MNKSTINAIIDTVAFAAFTLLTATGVLMKFVLPPGSGHFKAVWGLDRHDWGRLHAWIAAVLMAVLAVHLLLHWRWIISVIRGRPREGSGLRVALAIVGILALAGLAIAPFFAEVQQAGEPPHRLRSVQQPGVSAPEIDGTMTLDDVQRRTGVPPAVILRELGLPPDVPTDERLGRLRKQYGFDMHRLRDIVERHRKP
ncbi:MAG: DUF4405 domain-containing protein [Planctomycetaceae bacterium]|nr:DUF4405 domain-containing protein [Planctomycetaceae bacterium]